MPSDLSKQVVIAGITPCHFIIQLLGRPQLWTRRPAQLRYFQHAPQTAAAGPTRYSSQARTAMPHHKRVPGTAPSRSACAAWLRASSGRLQLGENSRLHSDTAKYRYAGVFSGPRAKQKLAARRLQIGGVGHAVDAAVQPLAACPWRQGRLSGLRRAQDRL